MLAQYCINIVFFNQMFYMPEILSQGAGMRLALHDPRDVPQVDEYGLYLAPSTFTDIGIQKVCNHCFTHKTRLI